MNFLQFIQTFRDRKGAYILFASLATRLVSFIVSLLVIHLLTKKEYGYITYAFTIIAFVLPFMGAGIHQGLLRFGALCNSQLEKKYFFQLCLKRGLLSSLVLMLLLIIVTPFFTQELTRSAFYLYLLSFQFIGLLLFVMVEVYARLLHINLLFAQMEILSSLCLLIFNVSLCYLFGGPGYIVSVISVPFFVGLYYFFKLNLHHKIKPPTLPKFKTKELIKYGLYVSIGNVLAQLLFAVDILIIGNLLKEAELVAQYKASSIIPFNLLILSRAILATDFVKLSRASKDNKNYLKSYYWNYFKIFCAISLGVLLFFYFFSEEVLLLFGKEYQDEPQLMFIFTCGIVGGMLFRVPLGNLLSAIGWPKTNAVISVIVLFLNTLGSYWMVQKYGLTGAAIVTSSLMWVSGLMCLGAFLYFLKKESA